MRDDACTALVKLATGVGDQEIAYLIVVLQWLNTLQCVSVRLVFQLLKQASHANHRRMFWKLLQAPYPDQMRHDGLYTLPIHCMIVCLSQQGRRTIRNTVPCMPQMLTALMNATIKHQACAVI